MEKHWTNMMAICTHSVFSLFAITCRNMAASNNNYRYVWTDEETKIHPWKTCNPGWPLPMFSTCQLVRCHGNCAFFCQVVTSTSPTLGQKPSVVYLTHLAFFICKTSSRFTSHQDIQKHFHSWAENLGINRHCTAWPQPQRVAKPKESQKENDRQVWRQTRRPTDRQGVYSPPLSSWINIWSVELWWVLIAAFIRSLSTPPDCDHWLDDAAQTHTHADKSYSL